MKPYWHDDLTAIYHGDVRDVAPALGTFDLIVADPPYEQTDLRWDRWPAGWPGIVKGNLTEHASLWCFGSLRMFMDKRDEFADYNLAQDLVWEKHNGSSFHADRFRRVHESIAQFYPTSSRWDLVYHNPQFTMDATKRTVRRKGRPPHMGHIDDGYYESEDGGPRLARSVQYIRSAHGYAINPTQKPAGIIALLLKYSCLPGGIVLDLFAGSLSTSVACRELGLRSIAIESDREQIDRALDERLALPLDRYLNSAISEMKP